MNHLGSTFGIGHRAIGAALPRDASDADPSPRHNGSDRLARKLVDATLRSAGVRIAGMFVAFLVGVQLARYLGPAQYGIYGTVIATMTMLLIPAQIAAPQMATREISVSIATRAFDKAQGAMLWMALTVLLASIIVASAGALICAISATNSDGSTNAYYAGFIGLPLLALGNLGAAMLRGLHRVVEAQIFDVLLRPAIAAVLLFAAAAALGGLGAPTALAIQALASFAALGFCGALVWSRTPSEVKAAKPTARWRDWAMSAAPMTGTELLRALDGQYAVLLFSALASPQEIGIFRVALSIAGFAAFASTLVNVVVMPYVAQLHAVGDRTRLQMLASGAAFAKFASVLLLMIALAIGGEPLIALTFGDSYLTSWRPLILICSAYAIEGFFGSTATILNMTGLEYAVTRAYAAGLLVGIAVTLSLYGFFGTTAAAIAMIVSEGVKGVLLWTLAREKLGIDAAATSAISRAAPELRRLLTVSKC